MRCCDYEDLISAYADGELHGAAKIDLERHIASCEGCKQLYEETMRLQGSIANILAECEPTPDIVSAVCARVSPQPRLRIAWGWAAAALILIGLCSYVISRPTPRSMEPGHPRVTHNAPVVEHRPRPDAVVQNPPATGTLPKHMQRTPTPKVALRPTHGRKPALSEHVDAPSIAADKVEVTVEYTDSGPVALRAADVSVASTPMPQLGPGQRIEASTEVITANGKPVERICYRISQGERNGAD